MPMFQGGQTNKNRGNVNNFEGGQHNYHEHFSRGTAVNKIGRVENANFGTNYGTINQSSGGAKPFHSYHGPPEDEQAYAHYWYNFHTGPPYGNGPRPPPYPQRGYTYPRYAPWEPPYYGPQGWDQGHGDSPQGWGQGYDEPKHWDQGHDGPQQQSGMRNAEHLPVEQQSDRDVTPGHRAGNRYPGAPNRNPFAAAAIQQRNKAPEQDGDDAMVEEARLRMNDVHISPESESSGLC